MTYTRPPLPDPEAACQAFLNSAEFEKDWERFWNDQNTLTYSYSFENHYNTANIFFQRQGGSFQYDLDVKPRTDEERAQSRENLYVFRILDPMDRCFDLWWYKYHPAIRPDALRYYKEAEGICVLFGWRQVLCARLEKHEHLQAQLTKLFDALGSTAVAKKALQHRTTVAKQKMEHALEQLQHDGFTREQIDRMYAECMGDVEPEPESLPDTTLATEWEVSNPALFGKTRHMLTLADDDQVVVLMVEVFPGRGVRWQVSPPHPDYEHADFARGSSGVGAETDGEMAVLIEEAKEQAYLEYQRWLDGLEPVSTEWE